MDLKFFVTEAERIKNDKNVEKATLALYDKLIKSDFFKTLQKDEKKNVLKHVFGEDAQDMLVKNNKSGFESDKGLREIFNNFFGMQQNWPMKRNVLGFCLVNLPDYPMYFLPAFNQSKTTGDAKELKKGEGLRGLITGALDGVAVGALVSGRKIDLKGLGPYVALGMGFQYLAGKVFPWMGEKAGQHFYNKNLLATHKYQPPPAEIVHIENPSFKSKATITLNRQYLATSSPNIYNNSARNGMKI